MVIISYDISNDKKRAKFAKYLEKFGHRIQYSVFEIDNSQRMLKNIMAEIDNRFKKSFDQTDSVYVFEMSSLCNVTRYGYAKNEENDLKIIT